MKSMNLRRIFVFFLAVFGLTFISCNHESEEVVYDAQNDALERAIANNRRSVERDILERRNDLARMRAADNNQVNLAELQNIVLSVFNEKTGDETVSAANRITGRRSVNVNTRSRFNRFENADGSNRRGGNRGNGGNRGRSITDTTDGEPEIVEVPETEPIEVHEFAITNSGNNEEWFVLASNDRRVGHILAITTTSLNDRGSDFGSFFNELLQNYIEETIDIYNDLTIYEVDTAYDEIEAALAAQTPVARGTAPPPTVNDPGEWTYVRSTSNLRVQRHPMLMTRWAQWGTNGWSYATFINHRRNHTTILAGCGPVAIAQIFAFHNEIRPRNGAERYVPNAFDLQHVGRWSGSYNLGLIRNMPVINNSNATPEQRAQVAVLMDNILSEFGRIGSITIRPGDVTSVNNQDFPRLLNNFGYSIIHDSGHNRGAVYVEGTTERFTLSYRTPLSQITSALNSGLPILARGGSVGGKIGHIWVIDGWGNTGWINEVYRNTAGQTVTRLITLTNSIMVHCNMGWDGNHRGYEITTSSGWFLWGIFNTGPRTLGSSDIRAGDRNYSSMVRIIIPTPPNWR